MFLTAGTIYNVSVYAWGDGGAFTAEINCVEAVPYPEIMPDSPTERRLDQLGDYACMSFTAETEGTYSFVTETDGNVRAAILTTQGDQYGKMYDAPHQGILSGFQDQTGGFRAFGRVLYMLPVPGFPCGSSGQFPSRSNSCFFHVCSSFFVRPVFSPALSVRFPGALFSASASDL